MLQSKSPEVLLKNEGSIKLTTKWARRILKYMEWSKRRGRTAKREMNPALYEKLKFSWKKDIANLVLQHNTPILNLELTPLTLLSAFKVTMEPTGSHTVCTIYLGFSFFNGFKKSSFTIHIGNQEARDKIP